MRRLLSSPGAVAGCLVLVVAAVAGTVIALDQGSNEASVPLAGAQDVVNEPTPAPVDPTEPTPLDTEAPSEPEPGVWTSVKSADSLADVPDNFPEQDAAIAAAHPPGSFSRPEPGADPKLPEDALSYEDEFLDPEPPAVCPEEEVLPHFVDDDQWATNRGEKLGPCTVWVKILDASLAVEDNGQGILQFADDDLLRLIAAETDLTLGWRGANEATLAQLDLPTGHAPVQVSAAGDLWVTEIRR